MMALRDLYRSSERLVDAIDCNIERSGFINASYINDELEVLRSIVLDIEVALDIMGVDIDDLVMGTE